MNTDSVLPTSSLIKTYGQPLPEINQFLCLAKKVQSDYESIIHRFAHPSDYISFLIEGHLDRKLWNVKHSRAFLRNIDDYEDAMVSS